MLSNNLFSLLALSAAAANAQQLTALLSDTAALSTLNSLVGKYPAIAEVLTTTPNLTIFAPSNAAFNATLSGAAGARIASNDALVQAILQYHVIGSNIPAAAVPEAGTFAPTLLTNANYSLVSGGQRVKAQRAGSAVTLTSGGGAIANVTQAVSCRTFRRVATFI